jgi:hypothetical protein
MTKLLPGVFAFLLSALAFADAPPEPPVQENDLGMAIFALLLVGSCLVVAWMVWRNHKKEQQQKQEGKQA